MKLVGHVVIREDTGQIVETMLFEKGCIPAHKSVRGAHVRRNYLFELNIGEGLPANSPLAGELLRIALTTALVTIVATGLTPEQKEALKKQAPNFTLLENFTLLPE